MNKSLQLFLTAFFQVLFVGANTIFISRLFWIGIIIGSVGISFIWTYNVKRIAFATMKDRIIYTTGALLGSLAGVGGAAIITN